MKEDWTTEDALSGSEEEDQIVSIQGGMGTLRKILGDVINKQDEEDWIKYRTEPWVTPRLMQKERLREPPTWTLALWLERKGQIQRTKGGV